MSETEMQPRLPRVVIIGGGFAGLSAAKVLRKAPVRVTLLDQRNYHLFQPLLYQVATAALSPADIASPIRGVLHDQRNTEVRMAEVVEIDPDTRTLRMRDGAVLAYDALIVASGATHAYFGNPEWAPLAPGLKTIEDATEIRRRFLLAFEAAEQEPDAEAHRALLTFTIVGGGPTGVEMAGAMAEVARKSLVRDFRHIDPSSARIVLLEGGPRLLSAYDPELSAKTQRALERMGVEVRTGAIVTRIEPDAVYIGEERIATRDVIWAAGVAASPLGRALGAPTDKAGRVRVLPDLSIPGHPEVFVAGDLATLEDERGQPLPGIAPVANQQGTAAARNVLRLLVRREPTQPFHYADKGTLATIGRRKAVFQRGKLKLFGWLAWLMWLGVHIFFLIGFRNRITVFLQWAWSYLTWQRGARLITGDVGPRLDSPARTLGAGTVPAASPSTRARAPVRSDGG